jgi:hypothetical protein
MTPPRSKAANDPAQVSEPRVARPEAPAAPPEPAPDPEPPTYLQVGPACKNLRSKGMYVYTDGSQNSHDDYDNTIYWCLESLKPFGPDNDEVHRDHCCDPARSCYREY